MPLFSSQDLPPSLLTQTYKRFGRVVLAPILYPPTDPLYVAPYEPVSVKEVKENLKITNNSDNVTVDRCIKSATEWVEGETNIVLLTAKWTQTMDKVTREVVILKRPVQSIQSVKYIDDLTADTQILIPSANYIFTGNRLFHRTYWPAHRGYQSFEIAFTAGYTDASLIPWQLTQAIIMLASNLYEHRTDEEGAGLGHSFVVKDIPFGVRDLLTKFIDWGVGTRGGQ